VPDDTRALLLSRRGERIVPATADDLDLNGRDVARSAKAEQ